VRELNARNPSVRHFSHRSCFFNVKSKKKVPAPLLSPAFCESRQHDSTGRDWARKLKHRPLAESRIAGRHLLGQAIQRIAALEVFGLQRCGLNDADQSVDGDLSRSATAAPTFRA
jgi:hypothetical protein